MSRTVAAAIGSFQPSQPPSKRHRAASDTGSSKRQMERYRPRKPNPGLCTFWIGIWLQSELSSGKPFKLIQFQIIVFFSRTKGWNSYIIISFLFFSQIYQCIDLEDLKYCGSQSQPFDEGFVIQKTALFDSRSGKWLFLIVFVEKGFLHPGVRLGGQPIIFQLLGGL